MDTADLTASEIEQITEALERAGKIEAIKLYRAMRGCGLKEAKQFIDQLIPQLIEQDPERFAALSRGGGGCAAAVLLLGAAVTALTAAQWLA